MASLGLNDIYCGWELIQTGINWLRRPVLAMVIFADVGKKPRHLSVSSWLDLIVHLICKAHSIDGAAPQRSFAKLPAAFDATNFGCTTVQFCSGFQDFFDLIAVLAREVLGCD